MQRFRILAPALIGAMLIAGCGGGTTTTKTTATGSSISTPTDGTVFTDPAGAYSLTVGPDWQDANAQAARVWFLPQGSTEFKDNVNVLVETVPSGIDLKQYTDISLKSAPKIIPDIKVLSNEQITLASGKPGTRLRFTGTTSGRTMDFLQIYSVETGKRAVVLTLTAPAERIDGDIAAAEQYMRTIEAKP